MERLVMDPPEFAEGRAELSLSALGIEVGQAGADFGESQVELQLARQLIGESATNRHLTNVNMTIPLRVQKESGINLAEAAYKLQQKVALWQAEGGWLRRDFDVEGKFAGSVGYYIIAASLSGLQGWMMAHRQTAPEVSLKLQRAPLAYSTVETETSSSEIEARELITTQENLASTSPGLIRRRITNKNASAHWRAVIAAAENRDYPTTGAETTAKLAYLAKELTRKGGSTEAERESLKVVRNTELSSTWLSVLDTEVSGVGHMTHRGVRRPWTRVYVEGGEVGNVQLRLLWRPLGTLTWSENEIVTVPVVGGWQLVDLGEVRCEPPALGEERWEGQIQARATTGSGKVDIYKFYPLPTEQYAVFTAPGSSSLPELKSSKSPTVAEDVSSESGGTAEWKSAAEAKVSDGKYAIAEITVPNQATHWLQVKNFGFAIPESATITGIEVKVEHTGSAAASLVLTTRLLKGAGVGGTKGHGLGAPIETEFWGGSNDLWGSPWTPANVNASSFGAQYRAQCAAAATLKVDYIGITVYYAEAEDENRICFATRSIELRSDGPVRQHKTANVWGRLIPEAGGFNFLAPVGGLENRKSRRIVIPSQGDLGELPDSGTNKLAEQDFLRAGYLFAREAA